MKTTYFLHIIAGLFSIVSLPPLSAAALGKPLSQSLSPFPAIPAQVFPASPVVVAPPTASSGLPVTIAVKSGPAIILTSGVSPVIYRFKTTGIGVVTLEASQAGNGDYAPARPVSTRFTVKNGQTITFVQPPPVQLPDLKPFAPFSFTVEVSSSSGLPVHLSVISGEAIIVGKRVTVESPLSLVLQADQPGNANFAPAASVTRTVVIKKGKQVGGGG